MSASFTNQTLAQIELFDQARQVQRQVYMLPKHLDEKVARLHLAKIGVQLTSSVEKQAAYIGVPTTGRSSRTPTGTSSSGTDHPPASRTARKTWMAAIHLFLLATGRARRSV